MKMKDMCPNEIQRTYDMSDSVNFNVFKNMKITS